MHFLKRLAYTPLLLLVISLLAFLLVHAAPGGPFDRERSPASPEIRRQMEAAYHLDEPLWKQWLRYLGLVWEKDQAGHWRHAPASWDISMRYRNHSVGDIITQAFPVSLLLGALAFGFAMGWVCRSGSGAQPGAAVGRISSEVPSRCLSCACPALRSRRC